MAEKAATDSASFTNYLRLEILLHKTNDIMRDLFITHWDSNNTAKWEDSDLNRAEFINGLGKDLYKKSLKIQQECLKSRNIKDWDLPLLFKCLKCLKGNFPFKILDQLKAIRNKLAHVGEIKIDDGDFEKYWNQISGLLLQINLPQEEIDKVRSMTIETIKQSPETSTLDPVVKELKDSGNEAFKKGRFEEAIDFYTKAISTPGVSTKDLAILYSNRSIAYLKLEDIPSAKADAKGSIHLFPTWWKGYSRLAMAYKASGKYKSALMNLLLAQKYHDNPEELADQINLCRRLINQESREEHLDPQYFCKTYEEMAQFIPNSSPDSLQHSDNFMTDLTGATGMCTKGHNYYLGRGVQQDYNEAAKWYGKAAAEGNAEGLYNLGMMYINGKGVQCNFSQGIHLLEQAASQPKLVCLHPLLKDFKIPNNGVGAAQHSLGLLYDEGTGVSINYEKARSWYTRAIRNWIGNSANNMAIMYLTGRGVSRSLDLAVHYYKLGAAIGDVRCMENLVHHYYHIGDFENTQRWYLYAVEHGSVALKISQFNFQDHFQISLAENFKKEQFTATLWFEIENGPLKDLVDPEVKAAQDGFKNFMKKDFRYPLLMGGENSTPETGSSAVDAYRKFIILNHRKTFKLSVVSKNKLLFGGNKANLKPKPIGDIFNLKPIYLEEMSKKGKDHIYEGFVLKLTLSEDPIDKSTETDSIRSIAFDEKKSYERLFIYNYNPTKVDLQEKLGFGTKISIVNPYYRIARDGHPAIRVDDFNTIFVHAKTSNKICRFCGIESVKDLNFPCRTCKRCYYCSKKCLKLDASELQHDLVCKKRI